MSGGDAQRLRAGFELGSAAFNSPECEAFELVAPNETIASVNDAALVAHGIGVGQIKTDVEVVFIPGGCVGQKGILEVATTNWKAEVAVSARGARLVGALTVVEHGSIARIRRMEGNPHRVVKVKTGILPEIHAHLVRQVDVHLVLDPIQPLDAFTR